MAQNDRDITWSREAQNINDLFETMEILQTLLKAAGVYYETKRRRDPSLAAFFYRGKRTLPELVEVVTYPWVFILYDVVLYDEKKGERRTADEHRLQKFQRLLEKIRDDPELQDAILAADDYEVAEDFVEAELAAIDGET